MRARTGTVVGAELVKAVLDNGLRVVVERHPSHGRTAVCVHYGVGYRREEPGREGFAHLFEHLMFRGSASLPDGEYFAHLHDLGGRANGTTHQDYTDYHQIVPATGLERALFAEADRMRAPRFTPRALAEQLDGIEIEIRQAVHERPYGGLPWPLLPGVLYRRFANAHDGYGDLRRLRRCTVEDCEEFFRIHYPPGNAVLTVVGDHDPADVLALVERHFGDIPPRPWPPPPALDEPAPTTDRIAVGTEPGVSATAVAIGYRLPDPVADLDGYLAHAVLARMVDRYGLAAAETPVASASCGLFGPLDALHPDTLVVTAVVPGEDRSPGAAGRVEIAARRAAAAATDRFAGWGEPDRIAAAHPLLVDRLVAEHHRRHADPYVRARALGRLEALFGRAELLGELPARLRATGPGPVAAAAQRLAGAARAVLAIGPGPRRTRPTLGLAPRAAGRRQPPAPTSGARPASPPPRAVAARVVPSVAPGFGQARWGPLARARLGAAVDMVAVRDDRAPVVEFRLRLPVGPVGWADLAAVARLTGHLAERAGLPAAAEEWGGELTLATDGQWLDASGYAPAGDPRPWLRALGGLYTPLAEDAAVAAIRVPGGPHQLMDEALRRLWLAGPPTGGASLSQVHRSMCAQGRAWLAVVGDLEPSRLLAVAEEAVAAWPRAGAAGPAAGAGKAAVGQPPRSAVRGDARVFAPLPDVHFTLSAPEPTAGPPEPARYLAAAVVGSYAGSRLASRIVRDGLAGESFAGRDIMLAVPRAYVRGRVADPGAAVALVDELRELSARPITSAEVEVARGYCAAQSFAAFDSPASKADVLRQIGPAGREPEWLEQLPARLGQVGDDDVRRAARYLFDVERMSLVLLGDEQAAVVSEAIGKAVG